jgi:copper chaperone CopZ
MATNQEKPGRSQHLVLPLRELGCAAGPPSIVHALRDVPGVTRVYVNPVTEMAYVEYESERCDESPLRAALDRAGYLEKTVEPPPAVIKPGSGARAGVRHLVSRVWGAVRTRYQASHKAAAPGRSP